MNINILLGISIITPLDPYAWAPVAVGLVALTTTCLLSLLSGAVDGISESEAKILHNGKSGHDRRIYRFYKRKEKVKASLSTAETFGSLLTVICAFSLLRCSPAGYDGHFAVFDISDSPVSGSILFFVVMAFILVITIIVPVRMLDDTRRDKILVRFGWLVEMLCRLTGAVSFADAYSNHNDEETNGQLTAAIGTSPDKEVENGVMIRNILQFGDIEVREIMTPRHEIVAIGRDEPFSKLKSRILESNFSRIPVFENSTDNIFGIIYVKDLIKYISCGDDFTWTKLVREIKFVPENKKISDLLNEFQQKKTHMAAVCDEYGGVSGLITMQDILEQIVGEISDEFDTDEVKQFRKVGDNHYLCDGRITLDDFCHEMGIEDTYFDDAKGDAESLAGLLLEIRGEFPSPGEKITFRSLTFSVESFTGRRIEKIGVRTVKQ